MTLYRVIGDNEYVQVEASSSKVAALIGSHALNGEIIEGEILFSKCSHDIEHHLYQRDVYLAVNGYKVTGTVKVVEADFCIPIDKSTNIEVIDCDIVGKGCCRYLWKE